jgi:hypothetical protein
MEEIELCGTVTLPVGRSILSVDYVNWNNRCWLVPVWLEAPNGQTRQPLRLIAPKHAPGFTPPPGPEALNIFHQTPLTQHVLDQGFIPIDLAPILEIVESPPVFIRINSAT